MKVEEINNICGILQTLECSDILLKPESVITFGEDKNLQIFTSNCVELTMKSIYQKLKLQEKLTTTIFFELHATKNDKIFELILKTCDFPKPPTLVINCDTEKEDKVLEILEKLKSRKTIIVMNGKLNIEKLRSASITKVPVTHSWQQLAKKFQEKLMQSLVNFQGIEMKLEEILSDNSRAIETISMYDLITKQEIKIGQKIKFGEEKMHIVRKFSILDPTSSNQKHDYKLSSFDDILKFKVVLLADKPGNGKSTELKIAAVKFKRQFPSFWSVYFDLKQHTKAFQRNGKVLMNFDEEIAKFLSEKLLKLQGFDADIFVELYDKDRVIILIDGVDEISPSFKEFVVKLIVGIKKKSNNRLWVATRPHIKMELEQKLDIKAIKLMEFTKENQREFFKKFFRNENNENFVNFLECFEKVSAQFSHSSPLLIRMVAELFEDDFNFELSVANLYTIYDDFVNKMIERLALKGSEAVNDSVKFIRNVNIIECHQKKALEVIFGWSGMRNELKNAISMCLMETPEIAVDQLVRIGLMFDDGTGKLHFIHRTFAEFFKDQFTIEKTFKQNLQSKNEFETMAALWLVVIKKGSAKMSRKFLDARIKGIEHEENNESSLLVLRSLEKRIEGEPHILGYSAREGCMNLIKFISLQIIQDRESLLKVWLQNGYNNSSVSVLMLASNHHSIESNQELWILAVEIFTELQFKKLLLHENKEGENVLNFAVRNAYDEKPFEFLLKKAREVLTDNEFGGFLMPRVTRSLNKLRENLSRCEENFTADEFEELTSKPRKNFKTEDISRTFQSNKNLLHHACSNCNSKIVKLILDEIPKSFERNEIKEIFLNTFEKTILMVAAENNREKVFKTLWTFIENNFHPAEQRQMLFDEDRKGWNVLRFATLNKNEESFDFIKQIYEEKLGVEGLKQILVRESEKGENILHFVVASCGFTPETTEELWQCMQERAV